MILRIDKGRSKKSLEAFMTNLKIIFSYDILNIEKAKNNYRRYRKAYSQDLRRG